MRRLAPALLLLPLILAPPAAAREPARGAGPQLPPRPDWIVPPPVPGRQIGPSLWRLPPPPRLSPSALAAARAHLCPHGGTPQAGGRCRPGRGSVSVRGPGGGDAVDPAVAGWHRGLAPPTRQQMPCPPGTRAVPARDQPEVTRCLAE
ncbi:MAG: hypothetical protein MUF65_06275 [Rubritepida sp.]|jgi:hypothetical protein|nr:hypothetical protein [Rubritepida sp.]